MPARCSECAGVTRPIHHKVMDHTRTARAAVAFLTIALQDQGADDLELRAALALTEGSVDGSVESLARVLASSGVEPAVLIDGLVQVSRALMKVIEAANGAGTSAVLDLLGRLFAD